MGIPQTMALHTPMILDDLGGTPIAENLHIVACLYYKYSCEQPPAAPTHAVSQPQGLHWLPWTRPRLGALLMS